MRDGARRRRIALAGLACLLLPAAGSATAQEDDAASVLQVGSPIRVVPIGSAPVTVDGHAYRGVLELSRSGEGVQVVNVVDVEDYVRGVQEMPADWPSAALEAQATVARTLAAGGNDREADGTIEARGTGVATYVGVGAETPQWVESVDATRGRILQSGGRPAQAHFHAVAGGRTRAGGPAEPYLRELDVAAAETGYPLYRWSLRIDGGRLADALGAGGVPVRGSVTDVVRDTPPIGPTLVVVRTDGGDEARVPVETFVAAVDAGAPARYPDDYPPVLEPAPEVVDLDALGPGDYPRPDAPPEGRRPATLPSSTFDVRRDAGEFVFEGRGWGSGLGMSKVAARELADAGGSARDILARFYEGTSVLAADENDEVRVRLVSEGEQVAIAAGDGFFRIEQGDGDEIVRAAHDPWRVGAGDGGGLRLLGPPGFGVPLSISDFSVPLRAVENRRLPVEFTVNTSADVTVHLDGPMGGGYRNDTRSLGVVRGGELHQAALDDVGAGTYRVSVEARLGDESTTSEPLTVDVAAARRGPTLPGGAGLVVVCAVLLVGAARARVRRRRARRARPRLPEANRTAA